MIVVKSKLGPGLVALWEQHPDHPGGEVYIADGENHEVAETHQVRRALGQGRLERVEPEKPSPPADYEPEAEQPKPRSRSRK